jgi:prepilin-type N-terminal cleavage/methylation domain-containing protein
MGLPPWRGRFQGMNRRGFTLMELLVGVAFLGTLSLLGWGAARGLVDSLECRAAREELAGLIHRARMEARLRGEGRVHLRDGGAAVLLGEGGVPLDRVDPRSRGVRLTVGGVRSEVTLVFGPLGLGRATSATFQLERGRTRVPLVLSSYGRVRR